MKKYVLGLFTVIIFLVACGSADNNTSEQTQSNTPQNDTSTAAAPTTTDTSLKINLDTLDN